ncbi:MAG TPA: helix-turn-helix transcriptional regulator [Sphingobium sp.]
MARVDLSTDLSIVPGPSPVAGIRAVNRRPVPTGDKRTGWRLSPEGLVLRVFAQQNPRRTHLLFSQTGKLLEYQLVDTQDFRARGSRGLEREVARVRRLEHVFASWLEREWRGSDQVPSVLFVEDAPGGPSFSARITVFPARELALDADLFVASMCSDDPFSDIAGQIGLFLQADLTDRERELVNHLLLARNIEEIAGRMSVSLHTVRQHLKSIFKKTSTNRQSELILKIVAFLV